MYTKKSARRSSGSATDASYHLLRDAGISLHAKERQIFLLYLVSLLHLIEDSAGTLTRS